MSRPRRRTCRAARGPLRGALARLAGAVLLTLLVHAPATESRADEISLVPTAGWGWGGTQRFEIAPFSGDVHIQAAPEYGGTLGAYGRRLGVELAYQYQPTDVAVRLDGFGRLGEVPVGLHHIVLHMLRQYPRPGSRNVPFLLLGVGSAGLTTEGDASWDVALALGAGMRRSMPRGGGIRLAARLLVTTPIVDDGFSFGAVPGGVALGGAETLYRGDISLGYAFPVWTDR